MKLRVATVCSGIGAPERALELLGLPFELVSFSEVDEAAIRSYCSMHGIPESKNFGDLTGIDRKPVPSDLICLSAARRVRTSVCREKTKAAMRGAEHGRA